MTASAHDQPLHFINPNFIAPLTQRLRAIINPATLEQVGQIGLCDEADVNNAIAAANAAQKGWRQVDAKSRAAMLHQLANAIEGNLAVNREAARLMTLEMGKPFPEAMGELANCAPIFRYYAEMARDEAGKVAGTTQLGSFQHARYEPIGVSVHIMPFNFPILLMCWTVAASLAAGNACIIKPAEATTFCTLEFMQHFRLLPAGLVSCVPGDAQTAQLLIQSDATHAVAFTGSVAAGKAVAVAGSVTAAFHLTGQICTSAERFFVVEEIHDAFVARFAEMTQKLRIGHGLEHSEIGPLVSEAARDKVMRLVADAVAKGATVICGGRIPPSQPVGWFFEPTILTGVTREMDILNEECFGPVAAICKVADFDQAIAMANDSHFGLGASLFSTDLAEAMEAANRLEAGMVWVNNPLIDNDALPFGGWKMSGMGRELGRQGLDAFRRSKMVIIDHQPKVHDWWYPYPDEVFYSA